MKFTRDLFAGIELLGSGSNLEFYYVEWSAKSDSELASTFVLAATAEASPLEYACRCHENAESFDSRGQYASSASLLLELMKFHRHRSRARLCARPQDRGFPRSTSSREILRHFRRWLCARAASTTLPFHFPGRQDRRRQLITC